LVEYLRFFVAFTRPSLVWSPRKGSPLGLSIWSRCQKTGVAGLSDRENRTNLRSLVLSQYLLQYQRVTDGQTDGRINRQTDRQTRRLLLIRALA